MSSPRREKRPLQSHVGDVDGEMEYSAAQWQRPPMSASSSSFGPRRTSFFGALWIWKWELLSLVGCLALLAAIFVTLHLFNEKDLPDWPISLNLNSLVAIYTTILRALLLYPVAEVIGQEKWAWFKRPRPLRHMDSFDFASRGAWGGIELIRIAFRPNIAMIAAVTSIVSLAIGPFAQQSIKTTLCDRVLPTQLSSIPVGFGVPAADQMLDHFQDDKPDVRPETKNSVLAAISSPDTIEESSKLKFDCTSGNCTFSETAGIAYSSLGFCYQCEDVTDLITESDLFQPTKNNLNQTVPPSIRCREPDWACQYTLHPPSGTEATINSPHGDSGTDVKIVHTEGAFDSDTSGGAPNFFVHNTNVTLLVQTSQNCTAQGCPVHKNLPSLSKGQYKSNIVGAKCRMYPCVRAYRGHIVKGVLNETVVSETPLVADFKRFYNAYAAAPMPCIVNNTVYDKTNISIAAEKYGSRTLQLGRSNATRIESFPLPCIYEVNTYWLWPVVIALRDIVSGHCESGNTQSISGPLTCGNNPNWWIGNFWSNGNASFASIDKHFEHIAKSMTNRMRSMGTTFSGINGTTVLASAERAFVTGDTHATSLCVQFDALWLLLPTVVTVLAIFSVFAMIIRTQSERYGTPAWKSSTLPLLFHGFQEGAKDMPPDHPLTLKEMRDRAKDMHVRYEADAQGGCGLVEAGTEAARMRRPFVVGHMS